MIRSHNHPIGGRHMLTARCSGDITYRVALDNFEPREVMRRLCSVNVPKMIRNEVTPWAMTHGRQGVELLRDTTLVQIAALEAAPKRAGVAKRDAVASERRDAGFEQTEGDGQTFTGYGAVFNEWTTIHDRLGEFRERVDGKAFNRTLRTGRNVLMQYDHGQHPMIGSIPLGKISALEPDARGLLVRARLTDNWLVQPVRDAVREGALTDMSFKFTVLADKWRKGADGVDERTLLDVELMEIGVVAHGAYPTTTAKVS